MKIKRIRNLKNDLENMLFVSVLLTIGCIFATLLYFVFGLLTAAVFTAKAWGFLILTDIVLFATSQCCDIWIWAIKTNKQRKVEKTRKKKISPLMWVRGFCKALAYYCF